jgi:hypothetical protein
MDDQLTSIRRRESMLERINKFHIVLIKPSKYDDDGYVVRFWKGVLPSNTLNVLHGLTEDIRQRRVFGELPIEVTTFDETAEKIPLAKIVRWSKTPGVKLLACLVGVQTNQFPRALDMARFFKRHGLSVIVGGFHTSGTINMLGDQEPDIQQLYREEICMVSGEVEGKMGGHTRRFSARPAKAALQLRPGFAKSRRHRGSATAANQREDDEALRLSEFRDGGYLSRLPVCLYVLHDHQCSGKKNARAQSAKHRRDDAPQLS